MIHNQEMSNENLSTIVYTSICKCKLQFIGQYDIIVHIHVCALIKKQHNVGQTFLHNLLFQKYLVTLL